MKYHHSAQLSCFLLMALLLTPSGSVRSQDFGPLASPPSGQGAPAPESTESTPSAGIVPGSVALPGSGDRPKNSRTVIDSRDGATFENASNSAEFTGHVIVQDPQFDLSCDKLHVTLRADRKGLSKVVATGNVIITQEKPNSRGDIIKSIGKCGKMTYDAVTGDVTLEYWPQIQQGINNQIATQENTVMILNSKGRSRTIGGSRTMIIDQGGDKAITP
jgi:hypothetical protein